MTRALVFYFEPCNECGDVERYSSNGKCPTCARRFALESYYRRREEVLAAKYAEYHSDPKAARQRTNEAYAANPEPRKARRRAHHRTRYPARREEFNARRREQYAARKAK